MEIYLDEFAINSASNQVYTSADIEGVAGLPTIRSSSGVNVGRDGGWVSRQLYSPRFISMNGRIFGNSIIEAEDKRREFSDVLSRKELTLTIITYAGRKFSSKVHVMDFKVPISRDLNVFNWKLDLQSDDPLFYDVEDGQLIATINQEVQGGFDIPFDIPFDIEGSTGYTTINNSGNATVKPRIEISGIASNPEIINITTGDSIKIGIVMVSTDKLVVDMLSKTITLNGTDVYGYKTNGSVFWGLVEGNNVCNLVTDVPSEAQHADVYYNSGFIGI